MERKLRQIIEIDPNEVQAYHLLGTVYQEKKEPDRALRIFADAAALFPKDALLHYDLGFLYFNKGVDSLAVQELTLATKLSPQAPEAERAQEILRKLGQRPGPPPPFKERIEPPSPPAAPPVLAPKSEPPEPPVEKPAPPLQSAAIPRPIPLHPTIRNRSGCSSPTRSGASRVKISTGCFKDICIPFRLSDRKWGNGSSALIGSRSITKSMK